MDNNCRSILMSLYFANLFRKGLMMGMIEKLNKGGENEQK
jgi:hypothetical protein